METEIRAKIMSTDKNGLEIKILALGGQKKGSYHQDDIYFKHDTDAERNLILRIRRRDGQAQLTFKAKAKGADTSWPEVDTDLDNPDDLESILRNNNYVEVVRISKDRDSYQANAFEVNIDEVMNLGTFIEIESKGDDDQRETFENSMKELLNKLGIEKGQIVLEGYVPLMLKSKKNF